MIKQKLTITITKMISITKISLTCTNQRRFHPYRATVLQVLCRQCEVNHYPIRRTAVPVLSIFFDQYIQSINTPGFVKKHLSNRFAPYFLFCGKIWSSTYLQC